MLLERVEFADLKVLAAHRQHLWEKQRDYVATNSPLHRRAWAKAKIPLRLEQLAEFPLINKEMLRESQQMNPAVWGLPGSTCNQSCPRPSNLRHDRNSHESGPVAERCP